MGEVERRTFIKGVAIGVASLALAPVVVDLGQQMKEDLEAVSSDVVRVDGAVYDQAAGMCAIDLVVDVAADERVVIENELPVGNGRTVRNTGKRTLRTVVPADSTVLIYAVNLETKTSERLKEYHVSEECTLREASEQ